MLEPQWLGRRVTVRRVVAAAADGPVRTADVVGDLVALDGRVAVVDGRDGLVEIVLETVVAARRAAPSTAEELAVEAIAAAGLRPAATATIGGWVLRADPGGPRRVNSVLPLRSPGVPVGEALARAHEWYAGRGLPLLVAVPPQARFLLDNDLAERGWDVQVPAVTMTTRLDVRPPAPDPRVELSDAPDAAWLELARPGAGDALAALLTRHDVVRFARITVAGRTVAVGRGVLDDGWLGISMLVVAESGRRRGLGTALVAALWHWAAERGAARAYLQVEADNDGAVALYERLGFAVHHRYHYRVEPPPGFAPPRAW